MSVRISNSDDVKIASNAEDVLIEYSVSQCVEKLIEQCVNDSE